MDINVKNKDFCQMQSQIPEIYSFWNFQIDLCTMLMPLILLSLVRITLVDAYILLRGSIL